MKTFIATLEIPTQEMKDTSAGKTQFNVICISSQDEKGFSFFSSQNKKDLFIGNDQRNRADSIQFGALTQS